MTRLEALYGLNTRSRIPTTPAERIEWYRDRLVKLETMKGQGITFARRMTAERITKLEAILAKGAKTVLMCRV